MQNTTTQWRRAAQFLEKYTSHFIWKGCVWEGVGEGTELQHIDPHFYAHKRFFSVLFLGCSTGGPLCWVLAFSTASCHQRVWSPNWLNFLCTQLYNSSRPPSSCRRHNFALIQHVHGQGYNTLIIPWADAPVIYIGAFPILTARSGRTSIYNKVIFSGIVLHINAHKTKYIYFNQRGDISTLNGSSLKQVDKFTYLGCSVSSTETDIHTWLAKAWTAINRLTVIWKSDQTHKRKRSFFQAAAESILLYRCTTWTLTKRMQKKTWRQLHKNATSNIEQVLEAAPPKPAAVRLSTTHHENYPS